MAYKWPKGTSGNPAGRKPGTPNKATAKIKEQYIELLEANLPRIQTWLDRVAKDDPKGAIDMLLKINPFVIPKMSETDITSDGEALGPINIIIPD